MELAAEGLYAAGLEPKNDRVMNLFYAGSLYGGFTSFFTILEKKEEKEDKEEKEGEEEKKEMLVEMMGGFNCLEDLILKRFVPRIGISLPVFPSWVGKAIQSYILYKAVSGKSI
jgi:hypothetical protein